MGLRRASMSPAFVPAIKQLVRCVSSTDARRAAKAVLRMQTVAEVRAYLTERLRKLCPQVANLDTT
jgi:phosphoenolpyruvate-protein kinase (PTS system EI component)